MKSVFQNLWEPWEYQLSLGVEFLRMSYKKDQIAPGKRAACFMIGVEALRIAGETYKN